MSNPNDIPNPAAPAAVEASSNRLAYLENDQLPVLADSVVPIVLDALYGLKDVASREVDEITPRLRRELASLLAAAGSVLGLAAKLVQPEPIFTELECQEMLDFIDAVNAWRSMRLGGVALVEADDE